MTDMNGPGQIPMNGGSNPAYTSTPQPSFFNDFPEAFAKLLTPACCQDLFARFGPRGGGKPKLSAWQWIMARVYHELARCGTFAANVKTIMR